MYNLRLYARWTAVQGVRSIPKPATYSVTSAWRIFIRSETVWPHFQYSLPQLPTTGLSDRPQGALQCNAINTTPPERVQACVSGSGRAGPRNTCATRTAANSEGRQEFLPGVAKRVPQSLLLRSGVPHATLFPMHSACVPAPNCRQQERRVLMLCISTSASCSLLQPPPVLHLTHIAIISHHMLHS